MLTHILEVRWNFVKSVGQYRVSRGQRGRALTSRRVILVTLPEQTPVLEASILQADLKRAGIHPWAWVVNSSVAAAQPTTEFLQMRAASEAGPIADVQRRVERLALVPLQVHEPIGTTRLGALAQDSTVAAPA